VKLNMYLVATVKEHSEADWTAATNNSWLAFNSVLNTADVVAHL